MLSIGIVLDMHGWILHVKFASTFEGSTADETSLDENLIRVVSTIFIVSIILFNNDDLSQRKRRHGSRHFFVGKQDPQ